MWLPTPFGSSKHRAQRPFCEVLASNGQCRKLALRAAFKLPNGVGSHIGGAPYRTRPRPLVRLKTATRMP